MIELIQVTNDPVFARELDALPHVRVWVDLERNGKAERQPGGVSFISTHVMDDVGRIKAELARAPLMVRVNPLHDGSQAEIDEALAQGADRLMLPMFRMPQEIDRFAQMVRGRAGVTALVETMGALQSMEAWAATSGVDEIYVGLNDLHRDMDMRFMFEPLASGAVDHAAMVAREHGLSFGFGGIARLTEGLISGRAVLAEHLRLGSNSVILSRTFARSGDGSSFADAVAALRRAEQELAGRSAAEVEQQRLETALRVEHLAAGMRRPCDEVVH